MYALTENNAITKCPIGIGDLKQNNKSTSFPARFEDFDYTEYGVVFVEETEIPTYDSNTQRIVELTPTKVNGSWKQQWSLEELSAEEKQQILDNKAAIIRTERNNKLSESDWTQFNDSPLSDELKLVWAQYRQELRDITTQEGFPHNIIWPEKLQ